MLEDDDVTMAAIDNRRPDHDMLRSLFPEDDIVEEEQMSALSQLISTASTSSEPTTHILLHPASSASFVFVLSHEGRIHQSSAGVSGHLGFRQEEFVGQSVFNFVPLADQSLITRLLPVACQVSPSSSPRRRERFRCAFLSRMRLDHPPREVQFEISALRCDSTLFDSQSAGCVVCVARRLPEEANKVVALSVLLDSDGIVQHVFTRNCSSHQSTFHQLVGGPFRAAVAPEYAAAAERLLTTQCDSPLELDLLFADKQFRVAATSLSAPRAATRLECSVAWCTVRKPSTAFQPQLLQQQQQIAPPPTYAGYETSPPDPQDALSLVCSSVFGDENMNMPATSQEAAPAEKVRKKPGPKKGPSKPRAKKGAAAAAATAQDSAVSSSTGDDKNSVLKSLLGAPIQHPMPMEMHPAYYNPVMYQQPQQSVAAGAVQQQQQQMQYVQQAQQQPNGYMVDMQQAQQWQQAQQAHPQQMYYQQQMAYQMPATQPAPVAAPAPTNSKKRKASNENGEKKPRGRQSAAAQAAQAAAAAAAQQAALAAQQQQQQQQVYYQQNQMMTPADMAAYRFDPIQQQQMQQQLQQQQQAQQHWMMQQQPGTMSMQQVPQQMQPAQLTLMQQQQSAAAAAQQQQARPMQQAAAGGAAAGSEFVRMELRQSLQAKQQMAGRPSPANAMDVAVGSVGSTGSTAGSGTFEYLSDLLSDAELDSLCDFKLCSGGNGCGFDLENDDYTRKVVQRLLS